MEVKALSYEDIENIKSSFSDKDYDELNKLFDKFRHHINNIIIMTLKQTAEDDVDEIVEIERLKRLINLAPSDAIFLRCKDKLWSARSFLLNKDFTFFIEKDYSYLIKKDQNQVMIETLLNLVKHKVVLLNESEQAIYWKQLHSLLHVVASYKKLVGEP